jgi:hypothetical protein
MGQFKPMVKMQTTEPSVTLHLKTGGSANFERMKKEGVKKMGDKKPVKMMDGGVMGALAGQTPLVTPMGNPAAARAMAAKKMMRRRAAMPPAAMPPAAMPPTAPMKKGGEVESPSMHKSEMKAIKGVGKKLSKHEDMPASKAHKGLKTGGIAKSTKPGAYKTGGVVDGQGGFKNGGIIKTMTGKTTKVSTAHADTNSAPTGDVKMGNAGGYKNGGMAMVEKGGKMVPSFAADGEGKMKKGGGVKGMMHGGMMHGGYMKGGAAKKHYATGGAVNNSGHAVAMPKKAKSKPVAISQLSGTFKSGGMVDC